MPSFSSANTSRDLRMLDRIARIVDHQILLGDVGDVIRVLVLGEQMIEGLILGRPDLLGDRLVPLLGVAELRIDVENHAAERKHPMPDHLAQAEFGNPIARSHRSHL